LRSGYHTHTHTHTHTHHTHTHHTHTTHTHIYTPHTHTHTHTTVTRNPVPSEELVVAQRRLPDNKRHLRRKATTQSLAPSQPADTHSLESAITNRGLLWWTWNNDLTVTEERLNLRADRFPPYKQNTSHWSLPQLTTLFASNSWHSTLNMWLNGGEFTPPYSTIQLAVMHCSNNLIGAVRDC